MSVVHSQCLYEYTTRDGIRLRDNDNTDSGGDDQIVACLAYL